MTIYLATRFSLSQMLPEGGHLVIRKSEKSPREVMKELEQELGYPLDVPTFPLLPLQVGDICLAVYPARRLVYVIEVKPDLNELLKSAEKAGWQKDHRDEWLRPLIMPAPGDDDDPREKNK